MLTIIKVIDPDITKLLEGVEVIDEGDIDIDEIDNSYYTHVIDENGIVDGRWQSPKVGTFIVIPYHGIPITLTIIKQVATVAGDIDRMYFNLSGDEETLLNANVIK